MKELGITAKIWFSIGVFVAGFLLSTILGQLQNLTTEYTLRSASESLFPAAQQSQEAEGAFQRAIKGFSDAVVMQDASGLDRAAQDGQAAVNSLQSVADISALPPARRTEAAGLAESVKRLSPMRGALMAACSPMPPT